MGRINSFVGVTTKSFLSLEEKKSASELIDLKLNALEKASE